MRLTTTTNVSVDGVMQGLGGPDEDRSGGFERGGWAIPLLDTETGDYLNEVYGGAAAFLFGRRTYEIFAGSWGAMADPSTSPIAAALNSRATTTLGQAVITSSDGRSVEFNGAEPVSNSAALSRAVTDLLRRKATKLAAYVVPAFATPEGGGHAVKVVSVEVSDGTRTERWMALLVGDKLAPWRGNLCGARR